MKKVILILTAFCMVCATGCGAVEKTVNKIYEKAKSGVDKPIVKSYAGSSNDAFIDEDGNLYMSGSNVGDGTDKTHLTPVKVKENIKSVILNDNCFKGFITNDGEFYTWGYNNFGILGQDLKDCEETTTPVKILDNVESASCDTFNLLALTKDGELYKCGGRGYNNFTPTLIMENVKCAVHNDERTAVITYDGELYTWETEAVVKMEKDDPHIRKVLDDVEMVSAGHRMFAGITTDGSLYTWGTGGVEANAYGYEAETSPYTSGEINTPKKIMDNVRYVQTTGSNTIAITEDDDLYVWGCNTHGLIGNGTVTWKNVFTPYKTMEDVEYAYISDESFAGSNIVALKKDGSLYAWGDNTGDIFGDIEKEYEDDPEMPKLTTIQMPNPKKLMDNVTAVSMYGSHMQVITKDNEAYRLPPTDIKNLISSDNKEKMVFEE